ncbi:unnamed protein product [Camellia sinensis]
MDLIEDVLHGGVERCVPLKPTGRSGRSRPVGSGGSVIIVGCLAIILGGSGFGVFPLVSGGRIFRGRLLPSGQGIFSIHVFLGFG